MPDQQPTEVATRLAVLAVEVCRTSPSLLSDEWVQYGSPQECARHHVALALDAAGVREVVKKLKYARDFKSPTSDKIVLYAQLDGYHKLVVELLALLRGDAELSKAPEKP